MKKLIILALLGLSLTGCVTSVRKSIETPLGELKGSSWGNGGFITLDGVTFSK